MPLPAGSLPDPPKSNLDASLSSTYSHPHISPTLVLITLYVVACLIDMNPMKLSPPWGQVLCFSYWCIYKYFLIGLSLNEYLLNKGKNSDSKVFFSLYTRPSSWRGRRWDYNKICRYCIQSLCRNLLFSKKTAAFIFLRLLTWAITVLEQSTCAYNRSLEVNACENSHFNTTSR